MENISTEKFNIFGLDIDKTNYSSLLSRIFFAVEKNQKISIAYANVNTLNDLFNNPPLQKIISSFDIIHPDGIGVYFASRILHGNKGCIKRMTGSDFYPILISEGIKRKWSFFFFGHDKNTLEKIHAVLPDLMITGFCEGYDFNTESVISQINNSNTNIVITGLGFPKQEKWIYENKDKLKCSVIIAVGEGIKVFSGTKTRGSKFIQMLGLEWFIRLITNPFKYWKRYLVGNPLFLYRIIKLKLSKFKK